MSVVFFCAYDIIDFVVKCNYVQRGD